jgi:hypothetical protein
MFKLDGSVTKNEEEYLSRLAEHSVKLLNQPGTTSELIDSFLPEQAPIINNLREIYNMSEILNAIIVMKSNKACGGDQIPIEFFNWIESKELIRAILNIFNTSFQNGKLN